MKRLISVVLSFVLLLNYACLNANAIDDKIHDSSQYYVDDYYDHVYSFYSDFMNGFYWHEYLTNDNSFGYVQVAEKLKNDGSFQICLSFAEKLSTLGWSDVFQGKLFSNEDVIIQYYVSALSSLFLTLDTPIADVRSEQVKADNTMTFFDYFSKAGKVTADVMEIIAGSKSKAGEVTAKEMEKIKKRFKAAFSACGISLDFLDDTLHSEKEILLLSEYTDVYLTYSELLQVITDNSQNTYLTTAARYLQKATNMCFNYRVKRLSDFLDTSVNEATEKFFSVMEDAAEANAESSLLTGEWAAINFLSSISKKVSSLKLGFDIGMLLGDVFLNGSDTVLRYYEILTMNEIREALIHEISQTDSLIDSVDDYINIHKNCNYLRDLQYVNVRGEYCVYMLQSEDQGLISWINMRINKKKVDNWLDGASRCIRNTLNAIEDIEPDWSLFRKVDYYAYILNVLVPQYGWVDTDARQTTISVSDYYAGNADLYWDHRMGIASAVVEDLNGDGIEDLLVLYFDSDPDAQRYFGQYQEVLSLYAAVYTVSENGEIIRVGTQCVGKTNTAEDYVCNAMLTTSNNRPALLIEESSRGRFVSYGMPSYAVYTYDAGGTWDCRYKMEQTDGGTCDVEYSILDRTNPNSPTKTILHSGTDTASFGDGVKLGFSMAGISITPVDNTDFHDRPSIWYDSGVTQLLFYGISSENGVPVRFTSILDDYTDVHNHVFAVEEFESKVQTSSEWQFGSVVKKDNDVIFTKRDFNSMRFSIVKQDVQTGNSNSLVATEMASYKNHPNIALIGNNLYYSDKNGINIYNLETQSTELKWSESYSSIIGVNEAEQNLILQREYEDTKYHTYNVLNNECKKIIEVNNSGLLTTDGANIYYYTNDDKIESGFDKTYHTHVYKCELASGKTTELTAIAINVPMGAPTYGVSYIANNKLILSYGFYDGGSGGIAYYTIASFDLTTLELKTIATDIETDGAAFEFNGTNVFYYEGTLKQYNVESGEYHSLNLNWIDAATPNAVLYNSGDDNYNYCKYDLQCQQSTTLISQSEVLTDSDPNDAYCWYDCLGVINGKAVIEITVYSYQQEYNPVGWRPGYVRSIVKIIDVDDEN